MSKTNNKKVSYRQIRDYYCIACIGSYNLTNSPTVGSIMGLALRRALSKDVYIDKVVLVF